MYVLSITCKQSLFDYTYIIIKKMLIEACTLRKKKKCYDRARWIDLPYFSIIILMIFSIVLNWCVTCWIVFHLESSFCYRPIRLKLNQDLIAWRDMAGRNWITTILSHHRWCTWIPIINGQGIIAEKHICCLFFSFDNYKEL